MRTVPLILAAALAVGAGAGYWLYLDPERTAGDARAPLLATADYLQQQADAALEKPGPQARARATGLLRQALARDPASPYRWCSLGEALAESGDVQTARRCFQRAIELGPGIPPVLMRAANFEFTSGDIGPALANTRRILELVREYDSLVFTTYARMGVDAPRVLEDGLPALPAARQSFLQYQVRHDRTEDARLAWSFVERAGDTTDELATEYVELLLRHGLHSEARVAWASRFGKSSPGYPQTNAIFNGGFEAELRKNGLDWRLYPIEGVTAELDTSAHSGRSSLRLQFNGENNLDYNGLWQQAVVEPGTYRFTGWMRGEQITTNEGPRFRLAGAQCKPAIELTTGPLTGTAAWTKFEAQISVPARCELIQVGVVRRHSMKFDNKIAGTVWIDDVSLERLR